MDQPTQELHIGSRALLHPAVPALLSAKNRPALAPNPPRRAPCIAGLAGKSAARPGLRGRLATAEATLWSGPL